MPLEGRRFRRRRKEQVFAEGYFIDHATDVLPTVDRTDETHHLYGADDPETDVQQNVGNLSLTVLDKFANNAILDLITKQDPGATGTRQYRAEDIEAVHVWANIKNAKNTAWIRSWIIEGWTPGMPYPAGAPNDKATYQMVGPGAKPRIFEAAWIKSRKVASGTATITDTPVVVPGETGNYAVAVKAIRDTVSGFEQQDVGITPTVVSSTGTINWSEIVAAATEIGGTPTHAMFYYLQTGTGVYPTQTMGKLRT